MILHTESFGRGEAIVFLHSGLQTGSSDFEHQRNHFKDSFHVIVPDLRGHGKSVSNDLSQFFEDTANDLATTLESLSIDSAHLVGASLGALAGLIFAKRFPQKVKSLSMSGVTPEKPENWSQMHKEEVAFQTDMLENEEAVAFFDHLHEGDWRQFLAMAREENWYPFNETNDLSGISAPILVLAGEGNPNEMRGTAYYRANHDHVHAAVIPFAAHLVHAEQPELYTQVLELFLRDTNCTTPVQAPKI